jgi:hypothetical protein
VFFSKLSNPSVAGIVLYLKQASPMSGTIVTWRVVIFVHDNQTQRVLIKRIDLILWLVFWLLSDVVVVCLLHSTSHVGHISFWLLYVVEWIYLMCKNWKEKLVFYTILTDWLLQEKKFTVLGAELGSNCSHVKKLHNWFVAAQLSTEVAAETH